MKQYPDNLSKKKHTFRSKAELVAVARRRALQALPPKTRVRAKLPRTCLGASIVTGMPTEEKEEVSRRMIEDLCRPEVRLRSRKPECGRAKNEKV